MLLVNVQLFRLIGHIQIWQIETDAGAEVRDGEDQKDHVPEQREVHHFGERVAGLGRAADAAAAFCQFLQSETERERERGRYRSAYHNKIKN